MASFRFRTFKALLPLALLLPALPVSADPGWDGIIGSEWNGITPVQITYDPLAPTGNFGSPGTTNHQTGYEIFTRGDNNYAYIALRTTGPTDAGALLFSHLYFGMVYSTPPTSTGSVIGFEVETDRAFKPGQSGYYDDTSADLMRHSLNAGGSSDPDIFEVALDWRIFTDNALGVPNIGPSPLGIRLRLSESFGYSVAGGANYGETRLGTIMAPIPVSVPEPGTLSLLLAAGVGAGFLRHCFRRRVL